MERKSEQIKLNEEIWKAEMKRIREETNRLFGLGSYFLPEWEEAFENGLRYRPDLD